MLRFNKFGHQGSVQLALVLIAVGSWLSGCGDDDSSGGKGGKGGTSGTAGNAGAVTGGNAGSGTGGSGGGPTGGAAGSTTAGSGGSPTGGAGGASGASGAAGNAGSAGSGAEGGAGMGGEGGIGDGGMSGTGMGGEGGSGDPMCATGDLSFDDISPVMQQHDHLPVGGMERTAILGMINTGMPLVFTTPEEGGTPHTHTLTFTAAQLTTLRNGGTIASIESSMGGPATNMHTHTYSIECEP